MAAQPKEIILIYCQQRDWAAREKQNIVASQGNIIHCVTTQREIDSRKEPDRCGAAATIIWMCVPSTGRCKCCDEAHPCEHFFFGGDKPLWYLKTKPKYLSVVNNILSVEAVVRRTL